MDQTFAHTLKLCSAAVTMSTANEVQSKEMSGLNRAERFGFGVVSKQLMLWMGVSCAILSGVVFSL